MVAVYFGDATPFSLTRHFDGRQAPDTKEFTNVIGGHSKKLGNLQWHIFGL